MNSASPLSSVAALAGDIDMRFSPAVLVVAVTGSPATAQSSSPVTVTVISPLAFLLSVRLFGGDTEISSGSHGVGVGVAVAVGVTVTGTRSKCTVVVTPAVTVTD